VWGTSANDVLAAGSNVMHWDGSSWTITNAAVTAFGASPRAVWSLGNEAWVVGSTASALHRVVRR